MHALLRGSHIFPGVEPSTGSPDFDPLGLADVWKGNYHGNPVCIKAIRTRNKSNLEKIKKVHGSPIRLESSSSHATLGLFSRRSRAQAFFAPEYTSYCSDFGGLVPILYYESLDDGWGYREVHPDQFWCQQTDAGILPVNMEWGQFVDHVYDSLQKFATPSRTFMS